MLWTKVLSLACRGQDLKSDPVTKWRPSFTCEDNLAHCAQVSQGGFKLFQGFLKAPLKWVKLLSHVQFFATPWTIAYWVSLSMGFSRQEYWSGLLFPSPDLPDPGIEPGSPTLWADALLSEPPGKVAPLGVAYWRRVPVLFENHTVQPFLRRWKIWESK